MRASLWCRILLAKRASFGDLHLAIQDASGWSNYHLFDFVTARGGESIAGIPTRTGKSGAPTPVP